MLEFDEAQRSYSYSIEEGPYPVVGYRSTLRVHEVPGRQDATEVQAEVEAAGFEVAFEVSGNPAGLATCLESTRPGGTVVQVVGEQPLTLEGASGRQPKKSN